MRYDYDEPDFATIDTLFSLAEAYLFMQLVELQDSDNSALPGKSYADIYRSLTNTLLHKFASKVYTMVQELFWSSILGSKLYDFRAVLSVNSQW